MKNLFLLIFFIFTTIISFSQNKNKSNLCLQNEKYMVGTWKMDTIVIKEDFDMGDYAALYQEKFKILKDSTYFVFSSDFSYTKMSMGKLTKGTWNISRDGTMINVKIDGRDTEEQSRILELNATKLIMSPMSESSNSKVVMYKENQQP
ncbi:MAG TPA: lipocalin family protein [Bacteroidales bacterium]|nr:lipocalin family protein [Bacteroidales bacterium]